MIIEKKRRDFINFTYMNKKGFTLVELLIVIAIIGILASALLVSLGGARATARDARRISDLRQVQSALELYYAKSGEYPSGDWTAMEAAIVGAKVGINKLPQDPQSGTVNPYTYGSDATTQQTYVLRAVLEGYNPALDNDIDGSSTVAGNCNDSTSIPPDQLEQYCISL